jgi:hypothetical protein
VDDDAKESMAWRNVARRCSLGRFREVRFYLRSPLAVT